MVPFTSWRDYKRALIGKKTKMSRNRISMQTVKNFSPSYGNKFPDNGARVLSRSGVALYVLASLFMFI